MTPQETFVTRLRRHRERNRISLEEIAAITAVGLETAKSRLRYAVSKLRRALGAAMSAAAASNAQTALQPVVKVIPERSP